MVWLRRRTGWKAVSVEKINQQKKMCQLEKRIVQKLNRLKSWTDWKGWSDWESCTVWKANPAEKLGKKKAKMESLLLRKTGGLHHTPIPHTATQNANKKILRGYSIRSTMYHLSNAMLGISFHCARQVWTTSERELITPYIFLVSIRGERTFAAREYFLRENIVGGRTLATRKKTCPRITYGYILFLILCFEKCNATLCCILDVVHTPGPEENLWSNRL